MAKSRGKKGSDRPEIGRFMENFCNILRRTLPNVKEEAYALGKTESQVYYYLDPSNVANNMKAHEIPFSTIAPEILAYLHDQLKENHHKLNGSVDDEWAEMSVTFAQIRLAFARKEAVDYKLIEKFKSQLDDLVEEWKGVG